MTEMIPESVMGWRLSSDSRTYENTSIYDYINGAGEVYLSFDFKRVLVATYLKDSAPDLTVEIFDMGSSEGAYGVFSYARQSEESGIGQGYEYNGGLLCFWKDRYFVCVLSESSTEETSSAVQALARYTESRIPVLGRKPELVELLPLDGLNQNTIRFFHTHPTLNYHYYLSEENVLNLAKDTRAVLGEYTEGRGYLLCIEYTTVDEAEASLERFVQGYIPEAGAEGIAQMESGAWVMVKQVNRRLVIALDAASKELAQGQVESMSGLLSRSH